MLSACIVATPGAQLARQRRTTPGWAPANECFLQAVQLSCQGSISGGLSR